MKGGKRLKNSLLDKLAHQRTGIALDEALRHDRTYQKALEEQDKAFEKMEKMNFKDRQFSIINTVLSANTHVGAVYGAVAYRLGLKDGIRLMTEIEKIR